MSTTVSRTPVPARSVRVLGMRVDGTSYDEGAERIVAWSAEPVGRYVCAANVHMTMECVDDPTFADVVEGAALVTPDGMPLVWALRMSGVPGASRVYGPTLLLHVCAMAAERGIPVGFYGGHAGALEDMTRNLADRFPGLRIAHAFSPPFRTATPDEDAEHVAAILASGARILFVGLGCPKQERWMAARREALPLVQLGVGAAFDFHAGRVRQAPPWLQAVGLEWAFRLAMEPRRLMRRYARHNPRFVARFAAQMVRERAWRG